MKRLSVILWLLLVPSAFAAWTDRYVSVSGAGSHNGTVGNAWTLAEALAANPAAGTRINIIAGTYANTTTTLTFDDVGTTTAPIWWRGYNTTIGDIDTNNALTKPAVTFTTGQFAVTGAHQIFSNLDISSQCVTAGGAVNLTGGNDIVYRCRIANTASNASARAISTGTTANSEIKFCYLSATTTAGATVYINAGTWIDGCSVRGGIIGISVATNAYVYNNTVHGATTTGIQYSTSATGAGLIIGNSVYSGGTQAILVTVVPTTGILMIQNNILVTSSNSGTYGVYNNTGADTHTIRLGPNDYYNNGTPISGFTEQNGTTTDYQVALGVKTESSTPWSNVDATHFDFSLQSTSNAKAGGFPGAFENESYTGYLDMGAVQRQEPASVGGGNTFVASIPFLLPLGLLVYRRIRL